MVLSQTNPHGLFYEGASITALQLLRQLHLLIWLVLGLVLVDDLHALVDHFVRTANTILIGFTFLTILDLQFIAIIDNLLFGF